MEAPSKSFAASALHLRYPGLLGAKSNLSVSELARLTRGRADRVCRDLKAMEKILISSSIIAVLLTNPLNACRYLGGDPAFTH
jgi:hypothetical protein